MNDFPQVLTTSLATRRKLMAGFNNPAFFTGRPYDYEGVDFRVVEPPQVDEELWKATHSRLTANLLREDGKILVLCKWDLLAIEHATVCNPCGSHIFGGFNRKLSALRERALGTDNVWTNIMTFSGFPHTLTGRYPARGGGFVIQDEVWYRNDKYFNWRKAAKGASHKSLMSAALDRKNERHADMNEMFFNEPWKKHGYQRKEK